MILRNLILAGPEFWMDWTSISL